MIEISGETRKKLISILVFIITISFAAAGLLRAEIRDEICGIPENRTVYVCWNGARVGSPDNCPTSSTTTSILTTTSTPATTILVTTSAPATTSIKSYCTGKSSGTYCDGIDKVDCSGGLEIERTSCKTVLKPIWRYPEGKKPSVEHKPVPGVCHENSEGADCCEETICG